MRLIDADALEPDADYDDGEYLAYSRTQIENAPTIETEPYEELDFVQEHKKLPVILEAPVIKTERKRGRWIKWGTEFKCDQCHLCNSVEKPYCPNCGADMREGDQDPAN